MARIIVLKFQSLTDPVLVKKVSIPSHNPKLFDVDILKQMLLKEMLEDDSIKLLGGNESTTVNDISILKYDEEIEEVVYVLRSEVFCGIENNVLVKLRKTDTTTSVIVHNGTDDDFVEGRTCLKRKTSSLDVNSSPVDTTSDSSFDNTDNSTDFLYSDSDSHAQNTLSSRKKPRCAKKATKRKNKVVKTPKALHSSMGIY
jgi:hypothetical protein